MLTCPVAICGKINPPFLTHSQMTELIHGDSVLVSSCLFKVVNRELRTSWCVADCRVCPVAEVQRLFLIQNASSEKRAKSPAEVPLSKQPVKHTVTR